MNNFTAEEVRAEAAEITDYGGTQAGMMLNAYAALLERPADSGRVKEDVRGLLAYVYGMGAAHGHHYTVEGGYTAYTHNEWRDAYRDAIDTAIDEDAETFAALAAQGQGEKVEIEAVGRVERDMTGDLGINWLIEGGIHGIGEGSVLLCADRNFTDDEGSATLYTHPASPAGVPDLVRFAIERCLRSQEALVASIDKANPDDPYASLLVAEDIEYLRAWLAAAPSAPEGDRVGSEHRSRITIKVSRGGLPPSA